MLKFLKGYLPKGTVPVNDKVSRQPADKRGIQADLNVSYQSAAAVADEYGMTVIPGAEITREPVAIGHFNALFIKDANKSCCGYRKCPPAGCTYSAQSSRMEKDLGEDDRV